MACLRQAILCHLWLAMSEPWMAHFSVAMDPPFKACHDLTLSDQVKASHLSAIYGLPWVNHEWPISVHPLCLPEMALFGPNSCKPFQHWIYGIWTPNNKCQSWISFGHVSLLVTQVKCFDNSETTFNQFSMISWKTIAGYTACRHERLGMQLKIGWDYLPIVQNGREDGQHFN